ncbi:MAG: hypothetical protein ACJAYU_005083 [Bradymonadia bacterium]|jgi:hypothetical protein
MSESRPWYTGIAILLTTVSRTVSSLRNHRLGVLVPVFGVLLLLAIMLWAINTIAPLAPFVYSLF